MGEGQPWAYRVELDPIGTGEVLQRRHYLETVLEPEASQGEQVEYLTFEGWRPDVLVGPSKEDKGHFDLRDEEGVPGWAIRRPDPTNNTLTFVLIPGVQATITFPGTFTATDQAPFYFEIRFAEEELSIKVRVDLRLEWNDGKWAVQVNLSYTFPNDVNKTWGCSGEDCGEPDCGFQTCNSALGHAGRFAANTADALLFLLNDQQVSVQQAFDGVREHLFTVARGFDNRSLRRYLGVADSFGG